MYINKISTYKEYNLKYKKDIEKILLDIKNKEVIDANIKEVKKEAIKEIKQEILKVLKRR